MTKILVKQIQYTNIELESGEPDIIEIWQYGTVAVNVIHVEREKIKDLIEALNKIDQK